MNRDKEVQDLAVSLTVASAQLLARLQAPPAADGSRNLHHYLDKLSDILEDLEEAVDSVEAEASEQVDEDDEDDEDDDSVVFNAENEVLCWHCELPIPEARLKVVPGALFCVACAEKVPERLTDPFEVVTESDARRYQKRAQQDMEDERRRALPRRSSTKSKKNRRRARRKPKSSK